MRKQVLTREREIELGRRVRSAIAEGRIDRDAEAEMAEANLGLVHCIARRIARERPWMLDDLIGPGFFGLFESIRKFDPSREKRFSTYAGIWIRKEMMLYRDESLGVIHTPKQYQRKAFRGHALAGLIAAARSIQPLIPGDDPVSDPADPSLAIEAEEEIALVRFAMAGLSDRARLALSLRFADQESTYEAIAERLRVISSTARRVVIASLASLRETLQSPDPKSSA